MPDIDHHQPPQSPAARRFRLLRAYRVTLRLLLSLGGFHLLGRLQGAEWVSRRMPDVYRRNARRLKETILVLKGLFIKAGQLISIMSNFLPEDFRRELEELQDRIPPRPLEEMITRIRQEFGKGPEALFAEFETEAIASASLAQVHKARLHDGRVVAVKVQYPDIEAIARIDLATIQRLLRLVGWVLRIRGLDANFAQIREMILAELDFQQEADHIEQIAANFAGNAQVSFPAVIRECSSQRVLTTEFIEGIKISDREALEAAGLNLEVLAERVLTAYCQMIFSDGLYHADPHPGNILVRPDGGIVFLDFGAVAQLSPAMKEGIPVFLEGLLRRNTEQIESALKRMGFIARHQQEGQAERIIEFFYSRFLEGMSFDSWNLQEIQIDIQTKFDMLADLRKMNISLREMTAIFQIPKDWVLLERTLLLLLGLCTHLHPTMNPMKTIRAYLEEFVLGKERDWVKLAGSVVKNMALSALTIPDDLKRFLHKANRGELALNTRGLQESARLLYALGHQLIYTLFTLSAGGFAYLAHTRGEIALAQGLAGVSGFFLLCLGGSFLGARKWEKKSSS